MGKMSQATQGRNLDSQRKNIVKEAKVLLDTEFEYRKAMREYRDQRHAQCDPLGLPVVLEDDPNWIWWTDMINDCESCVERLREDYRRITRLMES